MSAERSGWPRCCYAPTWLLSWTSRPGRTALALRFEQAVVQPDSQLAGRTLIEARIPQETGLIVIAVRKQGDQRREFVFNPAADTRLDVGDEMIVLGPSEQVARLRDFARA